MNYPIKDPTAYVRLWQNLLMWQEWEQRRILYPHKVRTRYILPWDISTSGESRFRQNDHSKKEKNQIREDWREHKSFAKDQSKNRAWCNCGRYLKAKGNRQARRWVRKMIHHERWDEIYYHQDMFVSSWDAC